LKKPLQVGVTGGIGAGKSLICKVFTLLGVPVYDADSRAKTVMTTDGILMDAIRKEFGVLSYTKEGSLNREYISQQVFGRDEQLKKLNALVHPRVAVDYQQWVKNQYGAAYVIKEAALLFETGSHKLLDELVLVTAPEQLRIERVLKRDPHRNLKQIKEIISKQMNIHEASNLANHKIVNDETQMILPQVLTLHNLFLHKG
jgi:dephospho-CoA kinase